MTDSVQVDGEISLEVDHSLQLFRLIGNFQESILRLELNRSIGTRGAKTKM